jgi:glycosyltransferase involved in cell wall biosynthesis
VTAAIHDLAWKKYPETFSLWDRCKLDLYLRHVVKRADKLIAVSESTKNDLLRYFPKLHPEKVRVIHHGFDGKFFGEKISDQERETSLASFGLQKGEYVLYVGALQPRKNLKRLIQAFEELKIDSPEAKLVLAGEVAWLADDILQAQKMSKYKDDILLLGSVPYENIRTLYQGARFFAFPSLYEGFGLPLLEAFASNTAVLTADNSSLREVALDGALYCQGEDVSDIAVQMKKLWNDDDLRQTLREKGAKRLGQFSWKKCTEETIDFLLK